MQEFLKILEIIKDIVLIFQNNNTKFSFVKPYIKKIIINLLEL